MDELTAMRLSIAERVGQLRLDRLGGRLGLLLSILVVVSGGGSALALEPFSLYDNFDSPNLRAGKWIGGEGNSLLGKEAQRTIENAHLRLRSRSVGFTGLDSGLGTNFVFLEVPDPAEPTAMKATITATQASIVGCAGNTGSGDATFAMLSGSFFNTTATPANGNQTHDVIADIGIEQDPARIALGKPPRVLAVVLECTDSNCSTVATKFFQGLGPINLGTPTTVVMRWDETNQRFIFRRDTNTPHVFDYSSTLTDASSPGLPFKNVEVLNNVANCTTAPRPVADTSALFDDVFLNTSATPTTSPAATPTPSPTPTTTRSACRISPCPTAIPTPTGTPRFK